MGQLDAADAGLAAEEAGHLGDLVAGQALRAAGWVRQTPEGIYECTLRVWEVGVRLVERSGLRAVAMPHIQALWEATQETTYLAVLDGADALYLVKIDSPRRVLASFRVGDRLLAYRVAAGRALLAQRGADALPAHSTDLTGPGIWASLADDFANLVKRGYAVNNGEFDESINGIAAPVYDSTGSVVASIGFSCPAERLTEENLAASAALVVRAARDLSRDLGFIPGQTVG